MSKATQKTIHAPARVCKDKRIAELVIGANNSVVEYLVFDPKTGKSDRTSQIQDGPVRYVPPSGAEQLCTTGTHERNGVILLPTEAMDYQSEEALEADVREFIHRYVELEEDYEAIATRYVMFTWLFDIFDEVPYLRFLSPDFGRGKSRALETVGSICYRPIFVAGSSTPAALRRIVDGFRGTVVADEQDFNAASDLTADYTKMLNQGFQRNRPIIVCNMGNDNREPQTFDVFGPKAVVTRKRFNDDALESRFLTLRMGPRTRNEVPLNLPRKEFDREALTLRNKLLKYRFDMYHKTQLDSSLQIGGIEDRLNQIGIPLLSTIKNDGARKQVTNALRNVDHELVAARKESLPGVIAEYLCDQWGKGIGDVSVKAIAQYLTKTTDENGESISFGLTGNSVTARKVGAIVRHELGFKTRRGGTGYFVLRDNKRLEEVRRKYGVGQ